MEGAQQYWNESNAQEYLTNPPLLVTEEKRRRTRSAGAADAAIRGSLRHHRHPSTTRHLLRRHPPLPWFSIDDRFAAGVGIRYGKYCGVGHSGCPGEKPCDDLDACCKIHDECVDKHGMTNVKCHEKFKRCIKRVQKSGKGGFSEECPYDVAVPTMVQGMGMAILMSQWANPKIEL
ncbi:putative phospholipase A2 homolog 1 [Drosera capensis]